MLNKKYDIFVPRWATMPARPDGFLGIEIIVKIMKKVYIFDAITGKDITPFVTLAVKGGIYHVFNSLGVDITDNIVWGIE